MKRLAAWTALLLMGWGVVAQASGAPGQSLGEAAKKEKERRERSDADPGRGPVPVIDNEQLSRSRGDSVSIMGTTPSTELSEPDAGEPGDSEPSPDEPVARDAVLTEKEIRDYRETWARVWAKRLVAAEEELELAKEVVFQCQSAAHYVYVPLAISCDDIYRRHALAEYRLKEIRQNRFNWEQLLPGSPRPPPQR